MGKTVNIGLRESDVVIIARPPDVAYDMVADVTRMGEWSPVCKACWWNADDTPGVGARFTGRNEWADRTWETQAEVVAADRGREFAFVVLETGTRWGYQFSPVQGGTRVTETWDIPPSAVAVWTQRAGADAEAQILDRTERTRTEIAATLAAIKKAAEST
jgi:Polyketide cyclase / dehydrase and lipid transport